MNNIQSIEKLLIKCIELSMVESKKYAKIITICQEPEFINNLRKIHITKDKHYNMLKECYSSIIKKELEIKDKDYELIGNFKNNLRLIYNNSIQNIDIYREMYFILNGNGYEKEREMLFEILLDEQIIISQNVYILGNY